MNLLTPILDHILPAFTSDFLKILKKAEVKEIIHYIVFNRYQFLMENKEIVLIFLSEILINEELQQDFSHILIPIIRIIGQENIPFFENR